MDPTSLIIESSERPPYTAHAINSRERLERQVTWPGSTSSRRDMLELTFQTLLYANTCLRAPVKASLAPQGMSVRDVILLRTLMIAGETTSGELSEALLITKGAVSQLLKKLESEGLVTRARWKGDRRVVNVRATNAAKERFAKLYAAAYDGLAEAFDGWDVKDLEKLRRLLTRLTSDAK